LPTILPVKYAVRHQRLAARLGIALVCATVAGAQSPARRDVRVCAGGDVSLGTNLDTSWAIGRSSLLAPALPDPVQLVGPLRPLVAEARLVLLNVEGAIGDGRVPRKCTRRATQCYAIRQPAGTAAALRHISDSGYVVGNVANNHAHDAGDAGFARTLSELNSAGVLVTGADTLATPVAIGPNDTVAVLGFSPWSVPDVRDIDAVRRHVVRAAAQFGRVLVTMHIGAEGAGARHTYDRTERFAGEDRGNSVAFAHAAIESGASLVIGHGPHVLRAMEWGDSAATTLVAYSLGNLVTYGPFNHSGYNDHGAILCVTLAADGVIRDGIVRSTAQRWPGIVEADSSQLGAHDVAELSRQDFPRTGADVLPGGAIRPRPR
jgi:hypothetical protein